MHVSIYICFRVIPFFKKKNSAMVIGYCDACVRMSKYVVMSIIIRWIWGDMGGLTVLNHGF